MAQTALQLISSALRLIAVLEAGEPCPLDMANDGLSTLNDMLDAWNADRLAVFSIRTDDFPFALGQQVYTIGAGGNFNIPRPARIEGMSSMLLSDPSNPIEVPITMFSVTQWQQEVPVKKTTSSFPQICYDDAAYPLRNLAFWPIPTLEPNGVRIYSWQALAGQTLSGSVAFPPAYAEAIRFNLAGRLAPEYSVAQISPATVQIAMESLGKIRTMNAPDLNLRSDLIATPAGYDYKADLFNLPY